MGIPDGVALCPFFGYGDIPKDLYDNRTIVGIENDHAKIKIAKSRVPDAEIIEADAETVKLVIDTPVAIIDADAWSNPYPALMNLYHQVEMTDPFVIFGTDTLRMAIKRQKKAMKLPSGTVDEMNGDWRECYNFWWDRYILPFLKTCFEGIRFEKADRYLYRNTIYWAAVYSSEPMTEHREGSLREKIQKMTKARMDRVVQLLREGYTQSAAVQKIGVAYPTYWRAKYIDAEFNERVQDAIAASDEGKTSEVEDALFQAAKSGNVTAIQVWLYNRCPERWMSKRNLTHTGKLVENRNQTVVIGNTGKVIERSDDPLEDVPNHLVTKMRSLIQEIDRYKQGEGEEVIDARVLEDKRGQEESDDDNATTTSSGGDD